MNVVVDLADGRARVVSGDEVRAIAEWQLVFRERCKDSRFYDLVEQTLDCGFEHHYLVLEDAAGVIRGIQPFFFVQQNLVEGMRGPLRDAIDRMRRRFPCFLTMRVLMVGNAAGEGHLGAIEISDRAWVANALSQSLKAVAKKSGASLVVWKDFPAEYRETLSVLKAAGFARVPSMPMTRLALKFATFEDYLGTLSRVTRKSLRRKFRRSDDAGVEVEVVNDITPFVNEAYPLYLQVHERSKMKFERLTKECLCSLGQTMPERARFFIWRQAGRIIAFGICLVCGDTIYDDYLGLDYAVALELSMYFRTFKDVLSWAIEHRLRFYSSSPLNYDPKLHLGHQLAPLDLYVLHTAAALNPIFGRIVRLLEPTRHDPVLRKFANAHEL